MAKPTLNTLSPVHPLRQQTFQRYVETAFDPSTTNLQKMNKIIIMLNDIGKLTNDVVNQWNDLLEWIIGDGLEDIVNIKLDKWLIDGTIDNIVNHKIFEELNTKIDNMESELDVFKDEITEMFDALKKEIENELKAFSILKNSPTYLYDIELQERTVNQAIAVDEQNNYMFATQVTYGSDPEGFTITRMGLGGGKIDSMKVIGGGHGTTLFVEPNGNSSYLWLTIVERNSSGEQIANRLCRFLYQAGSEITPNSAGVQKFLNFPTPTIYMSPFGDYKNGYIAFRHTDTTNGTKTHIEIHELNNVKNNIYQPVYSYVFPTFLNSQIMQGFALDGKDLYLGMGQTVDDFNVYRINLETGVILEQIARPKVQNSSNGFDDNFGEPEGMFLYTDPQTNLKTLLMVVVMNRANARRQKLFGISNNNGIYKFLGYQGEKSQNVKLSLDDGKAQRASVTKISDVKNLGWTYFPSDEMDNMTDHPNETLTGGWWLFNGATDTGNAHIQTMTRNSSATPHKYERVVPTDGEPSLWRRILGENIPIFTGDTSGNFTDYYSLDETIDNFDLVYIRLNSPNGLMAVTKLLNVRDIVSNSISHNFLNIPDESGSTVSFIEFAIEFNEDKTSFKQVRAIEVKTDGTRTDNISSVGVAKIIGVRV